MSAEDDYRREQAYAKRGQLHHDVATCKSCHGDYKYASVCRNEVAAILAGEPALGDSA